MKWLKPLILKVGKKPIDLARHLGLPPTRVYEMQRGKRQFQPREIPLAAAFLKLSPDELLSLIGSAPLSLPTSQQGITIDIDEAGMARVRMDAVMPVATALQIGELYRRRNEE